MNHVNIIVIASLIISSASVFFSIFALCKAERTEDTLNRYFKEQNAFNKLQEKINLTLDRDVEILKKLTRP